jgi:predicted metal-binding protein
MSRVVLSICTRCDGGERLHDDVKALRRARGLKETFKVDDVRCLKCCDEPIAVELEGRRRSTYTRVCLGRSDAAALVDAAVAYAALAPDEELPERLLPGEEG